LERGISRSIVMSLNRIRNEGGYASASLSKGLACCGLVYGRSDYRAYVDSFPA
jgi:hypothetical protein